MTQISKRQEFEEIAHCGGKVELLFDAHSNGVSLRWSGSGPYAASLFQLIAAIDGSSAVYVPVGGVDMRPPADPVPEVPVLIGSDREGMWGRSCPKCGSYFRTNMPGAVIICPYCATRAPNHSFSTKNQRQYVQRVLQAWRTAFAERKNVTLDMDAMAKELPANRPDWVYSEERQQNHFVCPGCHTAYDVLGEYAGCPNCGKRNALQVFERHAERSKVAIQEANAGTVDSEIQWEKFTRSLSDFEAMGREIRDQLARFPATPKRKRDIGSLNFQHLRATAERLDQWCGIELFQGLAPGDVDFLERMMYRRHLFTHNGGRVDEKYLQVSGDQTVKLHQTLKVQREEALRIVALLCKAAKNLVSGFEAMS